MHDNTQCLSAAVCKQDRVFLDDGDGEGEEFDFDAVDSASYSDNLSVRPAKEKTVSYLVHASDVN